MELVLDRVSKQYKNVIAVNRTSLRLRHGVIGLLGANGAGKTTLMRMICGILTPTTGEIRFDGMLVQDEMYRDILGYLPQHFGLSTGMRRAICPLWRLSGISIL